MKEFLLVFKADYNAMPKTPEEMQANTQNWMNWIGGIAAQNKLSDRGNRLDRAGTVVKKGDGIISDGPYTEIKESIMGYTLIKSDSLDEATEIAKGCPIFNFGGEVEVREINVM
ncbi:YciI family protein [Taibaiella soli]|uniref:Transcription initiation protein n=1 Tax=Taibaiella soli TaxID=1649169 RepID=A0A2W2BY48_9BACT|nr:YciI family protein [Taibaiella soli]PZF72773.1 transcription initiation protein [Taibaiella soli]